MKIQQTKQWKAIVADARNYLMKKFFVTKSNYVLFDDRGGQSCQPDTNIRYFPCKIVSQ